jgi:hypothetical protein
MAAAYFVSRGSSVQEAWETIRRIRPFIRPTRVQREQLERLAVDYKPKPS